MIEKKYYGFWTEKDINFIWNYLEKRILVVLDKYKDPKENSLDIALKVFDYQAFFDDMYLFGEIESGKFFDQKLEEVFGDKNVLKLIIKHCFDLFLKSKNGLCKLNLNNVYIEDENVYYRSYFEGWFEVEVHEAFALMPVRKSGVNIEQGIKFEKEYLKNSTEIWAENLQKEEGIDLDKIKNLKIFEKENTILSLKKIQKIIMETNIFIKENNFTYREIIKFITPKDLERIIKVTNCTKSVLRLSNFNQKRIYLLRDCQIFSQVEFFLGDKTESVSVIVNRKMLQTKEQENKYYKTLLEILYNALQKNPENFTDFKIEFKKELDFILQKDKEFESIVNKIKEYLFQEIKLKKYEKFVVIDSGFQGSINMLVAVLLADKYQADADVFICLIGGWFRKVYTNQYDDKTWTFVRDLEQIFTNDKLYLFERFNEKNEVEVKLSNKENINGFIGETMATSIFLRESFDF